MNSKIYGPTRCGEILHERLISDSRHQRKIAGFLTESFRVIKGLKGIKDLQLKTVALKSYVFYRSIQLKDLKIYREDVKEIQKRIKYIIKNKAQE
jgi:hypothetical protein